MIGIGGNVTRVLSTPGKNFENCVFNDGCNVCGIDIFDGTDICVIASKNFSCFCHCDNSVVGIWGPERVAYLI